MHQLANRRRTQERVCAQPIHFPRGKAGTALTPDLTAPASFSAFAEGEPKPRPILTPRSQDSLVP